MTKKTVKEWLKELPEPVQSQVINNINNLNKNPLAILNANVKSLQLAVFGSFKWENSPEGSIYWAMIHTGL